MIAKNRRSVLPFSILVFATLATYLPASNAYAEPGVVDCSTPRRAVQTWLDNTHEEPLVAAGCFDFEGAGVHSPVDREQRVQQLLAVFDQRGYYVYPDTIPDSSEVEGEAQIPPVRRFSEVYVEKVGDEWKFPAGVVRQIPQWYAGTFSVNVETYLEDLPQWMRAKVFAGVEWWQILGVFVSVLLGLILRVVVSWLVATYGARLIRRAGEAADATIIQRAADPVGTLAMGAVLSNMLPLLRFSVRVNQVGIIAIRVLIAGAGVMLLYRLVDLGSDMFARRAEDTETKLDDQLVPLVRKALKVVVVALGIIFVLQNMDVDVGSLIAGASLGGLAFTLAAKDTVANLFGSISIFADRPFQVGDWVVISGHEGVVEEVGMRSTRIRTFYSSVVSIPNSVVANAAVDNYGMRQYRRQMAVLGVTYDTTPDQLRAFVEGIRAILKANPKVRKDAYEVSFREFGASALEILVYYFFDTDSWSDELAQKQSINLEIMVLAEKLGVGFAFPTQTLHIASQASPKDVTPKSVPDTDAMLAAIHAHAPGGEASQSFRGFLGSGYLAGAQEKGNDEDAE